MSKSNRKEVRREETKRSSRRSGVLRRGRRKDRGGPANGKRDEAAQSKPPPQAQSKPEGQAQASKSAPAKEGASTARGGLDDQNKVSSLLETTGQDVKRLLEAADDASKQIREAAQTESETTPGGRTGGSEAGSLVGRINREVQQVLETADEAADKIREEARGEARQVVEEARRRAEAVTRQQIDRVSEMTDQVMAELSSVQGRLERLQAAYDQAMKTMNVDLGTHESGVWETKQNGEVEVEGEEDETETLRARLGKRTPRNAAQEPEEISEGARLLALQQLMAGVEPEVIERRLRTEFGIDDPKPVLDWMGLHAPKQKPA